MCIFSRHVEVVKTTKIFARASHQGRQFLAYQMTYHSKQPVAMILPLPTPPNSPEKAVRFINLEKFPDFFNYLHEHFVEYLDTSMVFGLPCKSMTRDTLEVVKVGSFVASFVPSLKDFSRLDPQFRLPNSSWDLLPSYNQYGFAVFQLQPGKKSVHPMAFEFPRLRPHKLFFPTVHIHDGHVHPDAEFDHQLYAQRMEHENLRGWKESRHLLLPRKEGKMSPKEVVKQSQGLLDSSHHLYLLTLKGLMGNVDIEV